MKWLKREENFEVVQFDPIQRTIQTVPIPPEPANVNWFLKFPYVVFARRKTYCAADQFHPQISFNPENGNFLKNHLFIGFSNKPIDDLQNDFLYCPPLVNVANDFAVCLGNYIGTEDEYINNIINHFWNTIFEIHLPQCFPHIELERLVNIPKLNLEEWYERSKLTNMLDYVWSQTTIPFQEFGTSTAALEQYPYPFAYHNFNVQELQIMLDDDGINENPPAIDDGINENPPAIDDGINENPPAIDDGINENPPAIVHWGNGINENNFAAYKIRLDDLRHLGEFAANQAPDEEITIIATEELVRIIDPDGTIITRL